MSTLIRHHQPEIRECRPEFESVPLGALTLEQQVHYLEVALAARYRGRLDQLQPKERQAVLRELSQGIAGTMNACSHQHLLREGSTLLHNTFPEDDEWQALDELVNDIRVQIVPAEASRAGWSDAAKRTVGKIWAMVFDAIGDKDRSVDAPQGNAVVGVRG